MNVRRETVKNDVHIRGCSPPQAEFMKYPGQKLWPPSLEDSPDLVIESFYPPVTGASGLLGDCV